jgi:hypothetical protein
VASEHRRLVTLLEDQGVTENGAAWIADVERTVLAALARRGEATATELRSELPEFRESLRFGEGKPWGGFTGVSTRVLFLLATMGTIVRARPRGSWVSSQYRWTRIEDRIGGALPEPDPETARTDLVRRWLTAFGPGSLADVKWWTGWTVRDTRTALESAGAVAVELDTGVGYVLRGDEGPVAGELAEWVAFLPSLDPTTMAWKERDWYLGEHAPLLFDRNGNAGPTIWWNGRVVGGWSQRRDSGEVVYRILEQVPFEVGDLIAAEASAVEAWLGDVRVAARFPTPLELDLRS